MNRTFIHCSATASPPNAATKPTMKASHHAHTEQAQGDNAVKTGDDDAATMDGGHCWSGK